MKTPFSPPHAARGWECAILLLLPWSRTLKPVPKECLSTNLRKLLTAWFRMSPKSLWLRHFGEVVGPYEVVPPGKKRGSWQCVKEELPDSGPVLVCPCFSVVMMWAELLCHMVLAMWYLVLSQAQRNRTKQTGTEVSETMGQLSLLVGFSSVLFLTDG